MPNPSPHLPETTSELFRDLTRLAVRSRLQDYRLCDEPGPGAGLGCYRGSALALRVLSYQLPGYSEMLYDGPFLPFPEEWIPCSKEPVPFVIFAYNLPMTYAYSAKSDILAASPRLELGQKRAIQVNPNDCKLYDFTRSILKNFPDLAASCGLDPAEIQFSAGKAPGIRRRHAR